RDGHGQLLGCRPRRAPAHQVEGAPEPARDAAQATGAGQRLIEVAGHRAVAHQQPVVAVDDLGAHGGDADHVDDLADSCLPTLHPAEHSVPGDRAAPTRRVRFERDVAFRGGRDPIRLSPGRAASGRQTRGADVPTTAAAPTEPAPPGRVPDAPGRPAAPGGPGAVRAAALDAAVSAAGGPRARRAGGAGTAGRLVQLPGGATARLHNVVMEEVFTALLTGTGAAAALARGDLPAPGGP